MREIVAAHAGWHRPEDGTRKPKFAATGSLAYADEMLNGIHIVDFGNHRNTRLTFGSMTALVGKNGSGKTTVMRAIQMIDNAWKYPGEFLTIPFARRGQREPILTASWTKTQKLGRIDWSIEVQPDRKYRFRQQHPGSYSTPPWIPNPVKSWEVANAMEPKPRSPVPDGAELIDESESRLFSWISRFSKTNAGSLQRPAIADDEKPKIKGDGSNLAWALAYLMTAEPDRFARIVEALKKVGFFGGMSG